MTFLGYVSGPSLFSLLVTSSGGYRLPFLAVAGQLAVMAAIPVVVLAAAAGELSAIGGYHHGHQV